MSLGEKTQQTTNADISEGELDVVVVGAGFAGLYQLHKLREKGFKVKLLEAGSDIGGIWHWNRYPGARVDSHGALYQYSDPALWKDWAFKELYPDWQELREYFDHVDSRWDLRKDVMLDTRVTGAEFDETSRKWTIHTEGGRDFVARFFVFCTGFAAKPYIPNFKGLDSFRGEIHHTGLWPQEGLDMTGKRIAVIGSKRGSGCPGGGHRSQPPDAFRSHTLPGHSDVAANDERSRQRGDVARHACRHGNATQDVRRLQLRFCPLGCLRCRGRGP
ncbi:flavin-containing monooxygenase [Stutzerimonas stutzeri]|uniref:flavin-containing monooxygenase n=1 Tax=Stutzerimonas stutzeri TaxID=316 RepID=UPI00210BF892|nr:NAD(P)/FAD-dependent oxidoreductase [Stutzerimonas stutzeri]MCQ4321642.1 NAD(P)/FAD-dependent oxidoreductase [Stutzerimonas stutzeri]